MFEALYSLRSLNFPINLALNGFEFGLQRRCNYCSNGFNKTLQPGLMASINRNGRHERRENCAGNARSDEFIAAN